MGIKNYKLNEDISWVITSEDVNWLKENDKEFASCKTNVNLRSPILRIDDVARIEFPTQGIGVSKGVLIFENVIFLEDEKTNKRLEIIALSQKEFKIRIETGFTFHYYAAILDAFIKLIAIPYGLVSIHASAILIDKSLNIFCAWRRMGKTTVALNLLNNNEIKFLADDAVFVGEKGNLIPYLRGIDFYPYLPISKEFLSERDQLKRIIAKILELPFFIPRSIFSRISKRFFTPRLNLANIYSEPTYDLELPIRVHMIYKGKLPASKVRECGKSEIIKSIARSSYFELQEYHSLFEMQCAKFSNSKFSKLLINYTEFEKMVELNLGKPRNSFYEIILSDNYNDLKNLSEILQIR